MQIGRYVVGGVCVERNEEKKMKKRKCSLTEF